MVKLWHISESVSLELSVKLIVIGLENAHQNNDSGTMIRFGSTGLGYV